VLHEQAGFQVVNAHGGLMRTPKELHVGQSMLLENPQNQAEQACRVVRVDDTADGDFAVAFELAIANPKFLAGRFPTRRLDCGASLSWPVKSF
jgi:hypothetical protein